MRVTELGIVISVKLVQPEKAKDEISVALLERVTDFKFEHPANK